jgi:hypothetical protein
VLVSEFPWPRSNQHLLVWHLLDDRKFSRPSVRSFGAFGHKKRGVARRKSIIIYCHEAHDPNQLLLLPKKNMTTKCSSRARCAIVAFVSRSKNLLLIAKNLSLLFFFDYDAVKRQTAF